MDNLKVFQVFGRKLDKGGRMTVKSQAEDDSAEYSEEKSEQEFSLRDIVIVFAQVLPLSILFALLVRTFLFQSFFIPSESMVPSLQVGDHLFVSKYQYGYSRYSLPFSLDLFKGRILASPPKRGDVAVFKKDEVNYIKRVMGLPGDHIRVKDGVVVINGKPVKLKKVKAFEVHNSQGAVQKFPTFEETLPNDVTHKILELKKGSSGDNTGMYVVPEGHYFMMGDNRDNSNDSRFNAPIGFIPLENFIGRANFVYFSLDREMGAALPFWEKIRWSRIFKWIS